MWNSSLVKNVESREIVKLKNSEKLEFQKHVEDILEHSEVKKMKNFIQHGDIDTLTHSYIVAYYSYWLCLRLRIRRNIRSVARGAMLHDFYLYDWHIPDKSHRLHGFFHPEKSLKNAEKHFEINWIEKHIIETHMWPLTIRKIPRNKESAVVCIVDKVCSIAEIIGLKSLDRFRQNISD